MNIVNDLKSLLPSSWSGVEEVPKVGDQASKDERLALSKKSIVAFVRHCGCPFAEKTTSWLLEISASHPSLDIIVITHANEQDSKDWLDLVEKNAIDSGKKVDKNSIKMVCDPDRTLYHKWGIGSLPTLGSMFGSGVMNELSELKDKEGIQNTETKAGSARWQNSGSFAVDDNQIIKWAHVAKDAADVSNFNEALQSLDVN
ncbi:HTH-type transcriptional regulator y4qH [Acrasis kona]|uniref:HTH-type transcriptional regulator y4qH n=1 Tax=Acrasis kona TaxID=1008807 RepID=A0AAW2ZJD6_9EUKA